MIIYPEEVQIVSNEYHGYRPTKHHFTEEKKILKLCHHYMEQSVFEKNCFNDMQVR